jgi:spermidine/putrescine transport system permease protein
VGFLAPLLLALAYSFLTRGVYGGVTSPWTLESYTRLWDPLYASVLGRSLWLSALSTLICLVAAFPLALFISRAGNRRQLYLSLVALPFWTSFLIRLYAWVFLLRDSGLLNTTLRSLGWLHAPVPLLYHDGAVVLGMVYGHLPFAVLPLYAVLEGLDPRLWEAAADLGASPGQALWRVILPLARPGFAAGAALVFIACMGSYLVPDLMGGGRHALAANVVQAQFTNARDWPFGAALSMALLGIVGVLWAALYRSTRQVVT